MIRHKYARLLLWMKSWVYQRELDQAIKNLSEQYIGHSDKSAPNTFDENQRNNWSTKKNSWA